MAKVKSCDNVERCQTYTFVLAHFVSKTRAVTAGNRRVDGTSCLVHKNSGEIGSECIGNDGLCISGGVYCDIAVERSLLCGEYKTALLIILNELVWKEGEALFVRPKNESHIVYAAREKTHTHTHKHTHTHSQCYIHTSSIPNSVAWLLVRTP